MRNRTHICCKSSGIHERYQEGEEVDCCAGMFESAIKFLRLKKILTRNGRYGRIKIFLFVKRLLIPSIKCNCIVKSISNKCYH